MGDIKSRPKAPAAEVVYVPQYVYTNTQQPSTPSQTTSSGNDAASTDSESTPSQQREKNLLSRTRSRAGTILTGFRGILAPSESQTQRKVLLGE